MKDKNIKKIFIEVQWDNGITNTYYTQVKKNAIEYLTELNTEKPPIKNKR